MKVGIDALAFYGPEHFIELEDLARARSVEPAKYTRGLGQRRMAVATPCEDTVTLAVNAALLALKNFDIDPKQIGMLVVGTETGVDHSKPVAVYVHEALELRENCRTYETKHACYGAMAGLSAACDWIVSGRARGLKALVIASDIARYGINTPGEPTQGAGAVAMVISENPLLMTINPLSIGDYTKNVMDFWRPLYSKTAHVDGHYSINCYLEALQAARSDALSRVPDPERYTLTNLDASLYHVPFVKMSKKAHHRHFEIDSGIKVAKGSSEEMLVDASYRRLTQPFLFFNSIVGNIYTGSLFLSLLDYLRQLNSCVPRILSLFSYGSGSGASFFFGTVENDLSKYREAIDPTLQLESRFKYTVAEYEHALRACENADMNDLTSFDPQDWDIRGGYCFVGTRKHVRRYSRLSSVPFWKLARDSSRLSRLPQSGRLRAAPECNQSQSSQPIANS